MTSSGFPLEPKTFSNSLIESQVFCSVVLKYVLASFLSSESVRHMIITVNKLKNVFLGVLF